MTLLLRSSASATLDSHERALTEAKDRYAARRPHSFARWTAAKQSMPGGNTRTVLFHDPFPLCMARGEGCALYDSDGIRYVDFLGEYTSGIYGHSNPIIQKAITDALKNGLSLSAHNEAEIRLANLICERYSSIELVRFTNSGTEANLMAIATAMAFTGRDRVLVFRGAYHGGVLTFGSEFSPTNVPHKFILAPYNDMSATRELIRTHAHELACILIEPMLGAGGCVPADPDFLKMLSMESTAVGAILIFDEIQTSRLAPGGRQSLLNIRPDLTTLGKYHGGGLSFGSFGGRGDLMSLYDPQMPKHLSHAGTFNNNVLSMAAGFAGLSQVLTGNALELLNRRGDYLRERLNALFDEADVPLHVTGLGSLMTIKVYGDESTAAKAIMSLLFFDLLERGFYLAPRGLIALSLPIGEQEIDALLRAISEVVAERGSLFGCRLARRVATSADKFPGLPLFSPPVIGC